MKSTLKFLGVFVILMAIIGTTSFNVGRPPIEVEDVADGIVDAVLGWDGSGVAVSQSRDGVRALHGSNQTISNSVFAIIALNAERFDDNNMHDNVTNNSRLTATIAGRYYIYAQIRWASNSAGYRITDILLNGTTIIARKQMSPNTAAATVITIGTLFNLAANDFVEIRVFQTSGGNLDVENIVSHAPEFMMQRLRSQ